MAQTKNRRVMRTIRHKRSRQKVKGTPIRPRLALFRSLNHIYAQIIDDAKGITLTHASSLDSHVQQDGQHISKGNVSAIVGTILADRAKGIGLSQVVLDTGGYRYHGRIKAFAEAAREGGLKF